ncbi:uncharacterized protein LOC26530113 isoform X2 [Drosophila willistoni]|nr:uncharacterized protein LOC26530113 isoform X2 [Drosophila willistoni]
MFQIILNIFQKPEPEPKTYLESLIETVTLNFDKFINIFPINDINRTFCSSFSMGFVLSLCFFGVRAWISRPKAKRVNLGPNAADFEDGILPVDFRASSKPFQVYPGLNVYYLHLSTQEELTYDDGARRTIAVQTVTSLQGDNIIIYEHMEEIIEGPIEQADSEIYSDEEGMDISDGNSQDDSPTTSDGTTVIAKSSVLSKKPSRIPVIVPRPKTPTNATDLEN